MSKISEIFSSHGTKSVAAALLAAGLLIFLLSGNGFSKSDTRDKSNSPTDEIAEYSELLEQNLESAVSKLTGDANAKVIITLESTFESIYASDASINEAVTSDKTDRKSEKQLVLTGGSTSAQAPVTVKKIPPRICGAVVVCKNGQEHQIKTEITALIAAALNISESKIYVTGGN